MSSDDIEIKLTPYLGYSNKLTEFFAIIGYEEESVKRFILSKEEASQEELELTFLSIVNSDISFEIVYDYILKQVYPEKPKIIKSGKLPKEDNIIFFTCIDTEDGTSKKFFSCYALRFYEEIKTEDKEIYFVPKAFLIYSQYPYFSSFRKICQKVLIEGNDQENQKVFPIEIFIHCLVNYIPSSINYSLSLGDFSPNIDIPKLTGYPYVDYNLGKILSSINLIDFIKIFILIFLEQDLLFFSTNLEKLNIFMFSLYILNYPLTDSIYFWNIKTISLEDIKNGLGDDAPSTSFRGINTAYNPNIDLSDFKVLYFVIDFENKKQTIINIDNCEESKELNSLLNYINGILSGSINPKKSYFLGKILTNFHKNLKSILKQYNEEAQNDSDIRNDFFYVNNFIRTINRQIQESFYDFILDILVELNNDFKLNIKSENKNDENNKVPKLSEKEKLFIKHSKNTVKYSIYFQNFLTDFNVYEGIKISLLYSDEYVNLKKQENYKDIVGKIKYFDIMDRLYSPGKELNCRMNLKALTTDYSKANYISNNNKIEYITASKLFTLDNEIIRKFIYKKKNKNYYKDLNPPDKIKIETRNKNRLIFSIQDYLYRNNLFKKAYYIRSSLAYIISICFPFFNKNIIKSVITEYLKNSKNIIYFERYFIFIILKAINLYYKLIKENKIFPEMNFENVKEYYKLIQKYLDENSIIKDEELSLFFKNNLIEKEENINDKFQNKDEFIYKYEEEDFTEKVDEDNKKQKNEIILDKNIKIQKNEIILDIGSNPIIYKELDKKNIKEIFRDIFNYYEFFLSKKFDIKKIDVNLLSEKTANLIFILNSYKAEFKLIKILCYLIKSLFSFQKQIENHKNNIDNLNKV